MSRATEIQATLSALPKLYCTRPAHQLLADIDAGVDSFQKLVGRWTPMLPRMAELDAAVSTVEGLRRLLAELRQHLPEQPDAA